MKGYKLIWDRRTSFDISKIWEFIAMDSVSAAKKVVGNIRASTKNLKVNPLIGPEEESLKNLNLGHRYIVYSHYKIIYRVVEDKVFIATVFDTRQNPSKLKKVLKGVKS